MNENPARLPGQVLPHSGLESIYSFALANKGWQGHAEGLHVWRWESDLFVYFANVGLDWRTVAADPKEWDQHLESWLQWRDLSLKMRTLSRKVSGRSK